MAILKKKSLVKTFSDQKKRKELILRSRMNAVKAFAAKSREKFGKYVKAVIVIGSFARRTFTIGSDSDVLVLIDDTASETPITDQIRARLHEQLQELANKTIGNTKDIHIQLHLVTEFWDDVRCGNPIFFNYLRTGTVVYDTGFFMPMKRLLMSGAIRPSREAILRGLDGARSYMDKISSYMEYAVERMYRAVTWSANAYVMAAGMPPAEVIELVSVVKKYFVETGQLKEEHVKTLEDVIKLHKSIEHGDTKHTSPEKVAELKKRTEDFVKAMEDGVKEFIEGKGKAEDLKEKIRTTPKIFWIYSKKDARGYAWLFESDIFAAIYEKKKLMLVLRCKVENGKLSKFQPIDSKLLFTTLEKSQFKPIITPQLLAVVLNNLPDELRGELEKTGVEYPNKALLDLSSIILPKRKPPAAQGPEALQPPTFNAQTDGEAPEGKP